LPNTGELGLLVVIEHHGLCDLLLQVPDLLPQLLQFRLELLDVLSCPRPFQSRRYLLGFAVHPLPAHPLFTGELADLAILTPSDHKRAANPSAKGYHAHG
jgi:hypothetical protein